ncbi:MAG TPA: molybdopterin-dependent oxidoreductase, partial [Planctomycetota bacterium]|nr:molybdopterin-dependent oxidoreductase [Planctomycetota bacterium]
YYGLLALSGEWRRLIPTSWSIFPAALHTAWIYLHFELPPKGNPYNALQQLTYAAAAFLFPAFMIATGLAMSPGVEASFPRYVRLFRGRQVARSLHFLGLVAILLFTVVHVALVLLEGFVGNVSYIMFGTRTQDPALAIGLLVGWLVLIVAVQVLATWATLRWRRGTQRVLRAIETPIRQGIFETFPSRQDWSARPLTPRFRVNGYPPDTPEFLSLQEADFRDWRLRVTGLVESPLELSLADLRRMPSREQTTLHNCIQGWSGIARWKGVPVRAILALAKPQAEARYVVFHSYQWFMGHPFYEVLELDVLAKTQSLLAYGMNGKDLPVDHGAPLRLRVENLLGYKMVKWLREIELVPSFELIGMGQGGHREDHRFYAHDAGI